MKILLLGLTLLSSVSSFAFDNVVEFSKRRNLFKTAVAPKDSQLNINNYMNCISYTFKVKRRKVALAATYFEKVNEDTYVDNGIGYSLFDKIEYKMEAKQLIGKVKVESANHLQSFRITKKGILIFEIASKINYMPPVNSLKSLVNDKYSAIIYGVCEHNDSIDVVWIDEYEILKK